MLLDAYTEFSDKQAVTATAVGSKVIDQEVAGNAKFNELTLHVITAETGAAAGAATVKMVLETSDTAADNALTGTVSTLAESRDIPVAEIIAGTTAWKLRMPEGAKRYIGMKYVVTTGPLTAGKFSSMLVFER